MIKPTSPRARDWQPGPSPASHGDPSPRGTCEFHLGLTQTGDGHDGFSERRRLVDSHCLKANDPILRLIPVKKRLMMDSDPAERPVLVLDFGAQYVQLIARRVRERHAFARIVRHDITAERVRALDPLAIILSGGPASVYEPGAPHCDPAIFELSVPVLGICYGMQLICEAMGVPVQPNPARGEFGRMECRVLEPGRAALPRRSPRDDRMDEPRRPDSDGG